MTRRQTLKSLLAAGAALVVPGLYARPSRAAVDMFIKIRASRFNPGKVTVKVGDTLIIENFDVSPHTATAKDGSWNTGTLKKGQKAEIEVVKGMGKEFYCKFHPKMNGFLKIDG